MRVSKPGTMPHGSHTRCTTPSSPSS